MDRSLLPVAIIAALLVVACTPAQQAPAPPAAKVVVPVQLPETGSSALAEEAAVAVPPAENVPVPAEPEGIKPAMRKDAPVVRPVAPPKAAAAQASAAAPLTPVSAAVTPNVAAPAAKAPAPAVTAAQTLRPSPPVVAAPPTAPPLDLAGLESRLRATKAIGVMTKLALKNQVDDLLDSFRSHYRGRSKTPLPELRASYDRLLMKVLSLLQDDDPALAKKIVSSREAIWDILSDQKKFSENNLMAGV